MAVRNRYKQTMAEQSGVWSGPWADRRWSFIRDLARERHNPEPITERGRRRRNAKSRQTGRVTTLFVGLAKRPHVDNAGLGKRTPRISTGHYIGPDMTRELKLIHGRRVYPGNKE